MKKSFGDIKRVVSETETVINPTSIFYSLEQSEGTDINDLYPVQKEAMDAWEEALIDGQTNNLISMDTGRGKTLVGLLIAESLRRRTGGKILYVCPNKNLITQTVEKARQYGIPVAVYTGGRWESEEGYLSNEMVCVTNYHSVYNNRSIFRDDEIRGVIFDDAHLSIEIIDSQYTLSVRRAENIKEYDGILKLLSETAASDVIERVVEGDPHAASLVPLPIWRSLSAQVHNLLCDAEGVGDTLQWQYVREYFDKALCFVTSNEIQISLLYPSTHDHFLHKSSVSKVFLSATIPNRGDLIRIFGEDINRITLDDKDYRPERLFIFSKLIIPSEVESVFSRDKICTLAPKTLVLTPRYAAQEKYNEIDNTTIVTKDTNIDIALDSFRKSDNGILVLAGRYDGIDLPHQTCRSLVIDGLPFVGSQKVRFFSEYFHNHQQAFLRSMVASKIVQAFGRTVRGNKDYSVVFILDLKLNRWLLDSDNLKFFKPDLIDDLELGKEVSRSVESVEDLENYVGQMLSQSDDWKQFLKDNRGIHGVQGGVDAEKEEVEITLAKIERLIVEKYYAGDYSRTIQLIHDAQSEIGSFSKPLLGLYLSIASVCSLHLDDRTSAARYSAQAYGIKPLFGTPLELNGIELSQQTQRILDLGMFPDSFIWERQPEPEYDQTYDEDFKKLGEFLGFESSRPEKNNDGTLDVLWVDDSNKVALGFELKVNKTTRVLNKEEIGQCHDHEKWMEERYPSHKLSLYAVGNIDAHTSSSTPGDLMHFSPDLIKDLTSRVRAIYSQKDVHPTEVQRKIEDGALQIENIFPKNKVSSLSVQ